MATEPATLMRDSEGSNRLVWVLNRNPKPYKEIFRGEEITVPANEVRIAKKIREGGNLMPFLEARRFLGEPKAPSTMLPNGDLDGIPKALYTVELSDEERMMLEVKTPQAEKSFKCMICEDGKEFPSEKAFKEHLRTKHA